jgi:recombination protein RecA
VVQPAGGLPRQAAPPHVPTGFAALDAITGCAGIPLGAITLFTGQTTSGKLTVAYQVLANAQRARRNRGVAILDLTYTANPAYLARCGVDLEYLLFARAPTPAQAVDVLFELARSGLRLLVVDGLPDLLRDAAVARRFDAALPELKVMLASRSCAVLFMDEPQPPWLRWLGLGSSAIVHCAALHVDLKREQWLERGRDLIGYRAQAQVIRSRWGRSGQTAPVEIFFDDTLDTLHTRGTG